MQTDVTPQVPAQEEQSELKSIPQTPPQPPVVPQTPTEPAPPTKSKKWLIISIILMVLIGLSVGGFFVWKIFFAPVTSVPKTGTTEKGTTQEEVYIYKGIWTPSLLLQDRHYLTTNAQKLKGLGINTIFIMAPAPQGEEWLEKAREAFQSSPGLIQKLEEYVPHEREIIIGAIQDAHKNGLKIGLTVVTWNPPLGMEYDEELLNAKVIEYAKLAEEYNVELFAPMGEPEKVFGAETSEWRQEIFPKVREVYHGEITSKGFAALPLGEELNDEFFRSVAEGPPGQFVGYDYIGFGPMLPVGLRTLEEYSEYVELDLKYQLAQAERDGCKGLIITEFGVLDGMLVTQEESARAHEIVLEKASKYDKVFGYFANSDFLGLEIQGVPEFSIEENLKTQEVIREWFTEILPEKKWISY